MLEPPPLSPSMPSPPISSPTRFIKPALVCERGSPWSIVRPLLERAGEEFAIVVDAQRRPVGAISAAGLLQNRLAQGNNPATGWAEAMVPVTHLPATGSAEKAIAALGSGRPCVVVDARGVLLGRPDLGRLLDELTPTAFPGGRILPVAPPEPAAPWLGFFEKLPLPLLLQGADGRIVARNQAWQETFCTGGSPCNSPTTGTATGTIAATEWCVLSNPEEAAACDGKRACPLCAGDRSLGQVGSWCLTRLPLDAADTAQEPLWLVLASDTSEQQQLYRELAARNADLAHLNRLKDEFVACISHELKSPLTAIVGLSRLLQQPVLGELNSRQDRYVKLIHQSGRQLMALVNDILDLTRLESGRLVLHPTQTNIAETCKRAYEAAKAHAASQVPTRELANIPYTLSIAPDLDTLEADELRLRQILTHLLSNALKFTRPEGKIGLRVSRWEGWIAFIVWDEGIGIPAALQHLIFQKFQQLERPLTREHEGTGLGLVLAQRLARAHGGDISFVSAADRGSEFTLLLPPLPPPASHGTGTPATVARPRPHTSLSTLVLLVETVPRDVDRLSKLLRQLGYRTAIARSSTEAIAKARILQPRAILLDPFLSPLSGWDVLTLLKSDPHTRQIPALVMASRAERQQAYERGADAFLTLPVNERALREHLVLSNPTRVTPVRRQNLTVLRLNCGDRREFVPPLETALGNISDQLNCRILEAEDLEQASMIARIWHPNAVLLDSGGRTIAPEYLQQLSACRPVAALPLIVLDARVAQAAHQLGSLTVFPCLIAGEVNPTEAIWSAILVAAGVELSEADAAPHVLIADGRSDRAASDNRREWLQALVQYLATAGYRSSLAQSRSEVRSQIQQHGIDLLLLDLGTIPEESVAALHCELEVLLGPDLGVPTLVLARPPASEAGAALAALLARLATQVLPGHPDSMADLLACIEQLTE